jgi:protein-tyrosine phosphatase
MLAVDHNGIYQHKVKLICEFCRHYKDREVPDPYYGGDSGFKYVIDLLLDACEGLLDQVEQTLKQRAS